ncbi:glycoside hydrolase family 71 protein [Hydnomerulius pinastri MD-312]|uniref:Unplaced genomic scaffold scaffold_14, whole genome shotgun sequence n=1 Tax=Hydnomerulius pinastri MD-312 TaxID=994086 RepID=A0A0C9WFB4_9AGAM|nr:glycoside hydrolase family 71 protein [Hydnomerulius pinastri MD-312]
MPATLLVLLSLSFTCVWSLTLPQLLFRDAKVVVAHFIVGNTYNLTVDNWISDISLASSKGIDGFALNIGSDPWQHARVADAYSAALKTTFKLFLSFDMTSFPCSKPEDAAVLQKYIQDYASHPNQLSSSGKVLVSTFGGEHCTFGSKNVDEGWTSVVRKVGLPLEHFIPSFFIDPVGLSSLSVIDGAFNWRASWPAGNDDITFDPDEEWIRNLGGADYMAGVSPWFFTHYGKTSHNKNFVLRGDDWLVVRRWEVLVENRGKIVIVQIVTWNDFGESSYVGPIEGVQPQSQAWTNGYNNHFDWLDLMSYFIQAFKTGDYPPIVEDRLFMWAKLFPTAAMTLDPVGKPGHADYLQDYLWGVVFLMAPAQVTLACGSHSIPVLLPPGIRGLALPLVSSCNAEGIISRAGVEIVHLRPRNFAFRTTPQAYNYNAFVAASPSSHGTGKLALTPL